MRYRNTFQHLSLWPPSSLFITALLSVAVLCWWLAPHNFAVRDSAQSPPPSVDENEVDASLQRAAIDALGAREGAIIVINPQDGRVRAVVNPSLAFEQEFSPGSTIKLFSALAAMQRGLINEKSRLLCHERYVNDDFEINCSHPKVGAPFDPQHAIAYSCNYYFGKLGERLDEDSFDTTLASFGFGSRTGLNHEGEAMGKLARGGRWRASNAIGEGSELRVTPIQLLTAYAALVNGGHLYTPQLASPQAFVKRERARLSIAPAHRALLIEGMRGAVAYGTALHAALTNLPLYIFGKTGTATASDSLQTEGWFVGFASEQSGTQTISTEGAELAVLVFLKGAHGAQSAEVSRTVFEAFARARDPQRAKLRANDDSMALAVSAPISSSSAQEVRVHLVGENRTVSVSFEDYVQGVLAAEGAIEEQPEALKALAVAVRTYALRNLKRHAEDGYDFCSTTHCQRYVFNSSGAQNKVSELVRRAYNETAGEVLLDETGRTADAYFHAACGGMTANVETLWGGAAPKYLRGVRDEYCAEMPHHAWTDVIPAARLALALRADARTDTGARLDNVILSRRDATGRAQLITLEGERRRVVSGWDFKIIVGRTLGWNVLKSSRFEVSRAGGNFIFRGGGFGHGVGLCQEGAHVMARRGLNYRQILQHYFPSTSVGTRTPETEASGAAQDEERASMQTDVETGASRAGFSILESLETWKADVLTLGLKSQRTRPAPTASASSMPLPRFNGSQSRRRSLAGEHFRLSYPVGVAQRDAENILRTLEAARADLLRRVASASANFDGLQTLDVIVHATTGDFVVATGQPSWAAGATLGRRIELQPFAVLHRRGVLSTTLRHEYVHAVIDALGQNRTPRWLAEGLAIQFAGEGRLLAPFETKDTLSIDELEQALTRTSSAAEMRALYAKAYRHVQALIRADGEASVWRRVARKN